jgi:serpin B
VLIVLPDARDGLGDLERTLSAKALRALLEPGRPVLLQAALPRFRFETRLPLEACLRGLGLGALFGPRADFSGWNGGAEPLWLDRALHQTFVALDEAGIEAAAATAISAVATSMPVGERVPFRVDRPFLFLVLEAEARQVLFLGRVLDPR